MVTLGSNLDSVLEGGEWSRTGGRGGYIYHSHEGEVQSLFCPLDLAAS